MHSIGIEWPISGDVNHNATAAVVYRIRGASAWIDALPLVRIDNTSANMLAGSILFLQPGTTYEVMLTLFDPDGGADTQTLVVTTRPTPSLPVGGRTFHVVPGAGGGDGSAPNPFRGIAAAQAAAQPGDMVLLHGGSYGGRITFDKPGAPGNYLVWIAAGDGEVSLDGIDVAAPYVWLEGLTIRNQAYGIRSVNAPQSVVLRHNSLLGNHYGVFLWQGGEGWYIADNTIVGDTPYTTGSLDGEGIELHVTSGHTVANNRITNVADGISSPNANVDLFGNDIFDTSDDGLEADQGWANVRMWGNRIHNAVHNGISFQPQISGPWYIVRNQIVGNVEAAFKFRTTDRFVLLHNTIVNWGNAWPGDAMMCCNEDQLLRAIARNNLWIAVQGGQIWGFDAGIIDWRTDLDYDGFDWGSHPQPFVYGGVAYPDVAALAAGTGLERHGIHVAHQTCFETFNVPDPPPAPVPPQVLTLQPGCPAVDSGVRLPNINDTTFTGVAPDLGAFERGVAVPAFGPRVLPSASIAASPTSVAAGQPVTLSWTTSGAASVVIRPSIGSVAAAGSMSVSPAATTTYTLAADGDGGVAFSSVTVTVGNGGTGDGTPYGGNAPTIPGAIQAENFNEGGEGVAYHDTTAGNKGGVYRSTDVDLEATTDAGGGYDVGWTKTGEWLNYTASVAQAGRYTVTARVAASGAGGTFHIEVAGVNKTGPLTIPDTGGWQAWADVTATVSLSAGVQVMRLVIDAANPTTGVVGNINYLRFDLPASGGSTPFGGTPRALPGVVQAEDFDDGGEGVAYHDTAAGNKGGVYRATDVDLEATADTGGGYDVAWIKAGEWLNYTVSVAQAGSYAVTARVAASGAGGTFHIEVAGVNKTGPLTIPDTGGWQAWADVTATLSLSAGVQVMRLVVDAANPTTGAVGNINYLRFDLPASGGSTPFGGTPRALPGVVQAEDFDDGGEGIAYHDTAAGNKGGVYRATDVDLEATADIGGGYDVGWIKVGEWLNYTVSVAQAGTYTVTARVAASGAGGTFHIEVAGVNKTGALTIPDTGGWQAWADVVATVSLSAGVQAMRLVIDAANPTTGVVGNINYLRAAR